MIGLIQRVNSAKVVVEQQIIGEIKQGFLVLLGVEKEDTTQNADLLLNKILNLRVFNDQQGKMNLNIQQINGELLIVSQFTLTADVKKGNRPGFSNGADPKIAELLYNYFCNQSKEQITTATGRFAADMEVSLVNDGPVTLWIQM